MLHARYIICDVIDATTLTRLYATKHRLLKQLVLCRVDCRIGICFDIAISKRTPSSNRTVQLDANGHFSSQVIANFLRRSVIDYKPPKTYTLVSFEYLLKWIIDLLRIIDFQGIISREKSNLLKLGSLRSIVYGLIGGRGP